ncbi:MAG TPA: hypothetical protein PLK12_17365 [Prolixibacteraceae bacterium]|nr:hypothetical protein [Prolixibacteraceae bacterium]
MKSLNGCIAEYKKQIEKGDIKTAYRGLMEFMLYLKNHLASKHPGYQVSGGLYFGYMDMTYFSITPEALSEKKLKIALVFLHDSIRFEAWLAGANKQIQLEYWKLFSASGWDKHSVPADLKGRDSIVETVLVEQPDFDDLETLTRQIDQGLQLFAKDLIDFF